MIEDAKNVEPYTVHRKVTAGWLNSALSGLAIVGWVVLQFYFELPFDSLLWGAELRDSPGVTLRFLGFGLQVLQIFFCLPLLYFLLSGRVSAAALYAVPFLYQGIVFHGLTSLVGL